MNAYNYLTMDTETCNMVNDCQLPYNVGLLVHDRYANIKEKYNIIIKEVFYGMQDLMFNSNYYANKLPKYFEAIENGEMVVMSMYEVKMLIKTLCEKYNIKAIIAHNARFDDVACKNLTRYITKSKYRYFLPYGVDIYDSQKMAHDTICQLKKYRKFCEENGYMTNHKKPRPQEKAEVIYRYLTNNTEFIEEHIGLQDCEIEMAITCKCFAMHKKMRRKLYENA